jgi:hypothetical protein
MEDLNPTNENLHKDAPQQVQSEPQITELIYMPGPGDNDTAIVDGVEFKAYEPTKVEGARAYLGGKLHANPFFSSSQDKKSDHDDRKKAWEANREAKKKLDVAKAEVEQLEKAQA